MEDTNVPNTNSTFDYALHCAVTANWKDLTLGSPITAMQVEYRTGSARSLEYLKLWCSTLRGHWQLICEYWMKPTGTHQQGVTFAHTYSSTGLVRMLDVIMGHQEAFPQLSPDLLDGLVQVAAPTATQTTAANHHMTETLERITSRNSGGTTTAAMRAAAGHSALEN
jgi:hypothetical protein